MRGFDRLIAIAVLGLLALCAAAPVQAQTRITYQFDLPAQALAESLRTLARQTNTSILFESSKVENLSAPALNAQVTLDEAIRRLLSGTGLSASRMPDDAVVIQKTAAGAANGTALPGTTLASVEDLSPATAKGTGENPQNAPPGNSLEEIVVTGSHIRGTTTSASPLLQIDQEDIQRSGYSTVEQLLHALPQNFGGGNSAAVISGISGGEGSNNNISNGSGINLRGLGNTSTLVLLNGRRVAPMGVGNFVDVSMIPLGLVERIDILSDGASAIYGADAVGGVVNIVTRKRFDGAETRLRYGTATEGNYSEKQINQALGTSWSSGSGFISYDYTRNSRLSAEDRSFAETAHMPTDLIGRNRKDSVLASLSQDLPGGFNVFTDALYSQRKSYIESYSVWETTFDNDIKQYGLTLGVKRQFGSEWAAALAANYSANRNDRVLDFPEYAGETYFTTARLKTSSVDLTVDGSAFSLPAGDARVAFGVNLRRESFDALGDVTTPGKLDRSTTAVYSELYMPLIAAGDGNPGVDMLEATVAARYEHYDDFGSSTNPKVGLRFSPLQGLSIRGTFGTSFRAPGLFELSPAAFSSASPTYVSASANGGSVPVIFLYGNNADLDPERARTWTFGFDASPAVLGGAKLSLTYFDITFKERISTLLQAGSGDDVLFNPVYSAGLTLNPDLAVVEAIYASPEFVNFAGAAPEEIVAIFDNRLLNLSKRHQTGTDLDLSYDRDTRLGDFGVHLFASYYFKIDDRLNTLSPKLSVVNQLYFPTRFRARSSVDWTRGGMSIAAFLNYTDSYRDMRTPLSVPVDSWATTDLTMSYQTAENDSGPWSGIRVAVSAINLFNKNPPFVAQVYGVNFDPINANALGRQLSLSVSKRW